MLTERQINNRMVKLMDLELQRKELDSRIEELKDEIRNEMGADEILHTSKFHIKNTPVTRVLIDSKALEKAHPVIYKNFSYKSMYSRFTYKEVK